MLKALLKIAAIHVIALFMSLTIWFWIAGLTLVVLVWWPYSARLRNIIEQIFGLPAEMAVGAKTKLSLTDYPFFIIRNISALAMFLAGYLLLIREGFAGQSILFWLLGSQ